MPKNKQRLYDGYGVYKITCIENSRIYIGGSNTVYNRICNQKCRLRTANPACIPELLRDFQKYGENAFRFEIVHHCESRADFLRKEQSLIEAYRSTGLLYNIINAYTEKIPRRKNSPRGKRFQIYLPVRQRKWVEEKSNAKNICRNLLLEILVDDLIKNDLTRAKERDEG